MLKKFKGYLQKGLVAAVLTGSALSLSCANDFDPFHEVFRHDEEKNMAPFPDSIKLNYSQYDEEKKHTTVINNRAYREKEDKPSPTIEEIVNIPAGKVYKITALKADYIENGDELILRYGSRIPATDLQKRLANVEFFEDFKINPYSNRLFFNGKKETFGDFARFRTLINFLDVPGEQIRVAVSAIKFFRDNTYDKEWNLDVLREEIRVFNLNLPSNPDPTKTLDSGIEINPFYNFHSHEDKILGVLKFLNSHGEAKVASHSDVIVSNGETATLSSKSNVPYEEWVEGKTSFIRAIKYRDTGTSVTITPNANEEGYITVKLDIETGEQTGFYGKEQVPVFETSTYKTTINLRNGKTEIAGVSLSDRFNSVNRGVPLIDTIPIVKDIVSSKEIGKSGSELIYIATARVFGRDDFVEFEINNENVLSNDFSHNFYEKSKSPAEAVEEVSKTLGKD